MILEKMTSCLWKLVLGFWTYGWIRLLGPSGLNMASKPQTPRSRHFLRFRDGALKLKYLWNHSVKFKKWAHSEILSLRAFKWCQNQLYDFHKVSILGDLPNCTLFFLFKYVPKYTGFKNFYYLVSVLSFVIDKFFLANFFFVQEFS